MKVIARYAIYSFFGVAPGWLFGYNIDTWQFWVFILIANTLLAWKLWEEDRP